MVKGFIFFRDGKIPFVIENYRMELFTDDSLLDDFCKEYNFKENYILHGQCFDIGIRGRKATFLVENSMEDQVAKKINTYCQQSLRQPTIRATIIIIILQEN